MALGFRKFISEVFVNGKFPKILPSENFPLYGMLINPHMPMNTNWLTKSKIIAGMEETAFHW